MIKKTAGKCLLFAIVLYWLSAPCAAAAAEQPKAKSEQEKLSAVLDDAWTKVKLYFYDPKFNGADWYGLRARYMEMADKAKDTGELETIINQMLAETKTSNTKFYTKDSPDYYNILDMSHDPAVMEEIRKIFPDGRVSYTGIGITTKKINGGDFISSVLENGPGFKAGLNIGDRIISVDGAPYSPVKAFAGKSGMDVKVKIQTTPDPASIKEVAVTVADIKPKEVFWDAMKGSVKVIEREGLRIGYIHIWSYAGEQYYQLLMSEIALGRLKDADALVIDLRNGWGGASPYYLNIFHKNVPVITQIDRDGAKTVMDFQWRKPAAMLVNEDTHGGDEIIAYGFKKYGMGKIMGSKTAGAVMGSMPFVLRDGSLLNLAVSDMLADGDRIEGKGVAPDIEINMPLEYANGKDAQLDWAINILYAEVMGKRR